ncbi:MAG: hypothetical protein ABID83_05860 [Candidatus Omnitrophota bacterium]
MEKVRYEIDPYNRLVLDKTGKKSNLSKFRNVLDGRFKIDKNNNLSCHIKAPSAKREGVPHQLKLKGEWRLTDDHDLCLTLDKKGRDTLGDKILLKGNILDVNKNSLLFAVTTTTKENTRLTYVLELEGTWTADKNNRLTFHVKREKGAHDILTFKGAWKINKDHQIIYEYEKTSLTRKKKKLHTLTFKGHWYIRDKFRISYVLGKGTDSSFNFETSAGIFRDNCIKYELGIRLTTRAKPIKRSVILFGEWKIKKAAGLVFEVRCADKKVQTIVFGAEAKLTNKDTISFNLKNDIENKDVGVNLELSHKILKGDGEAFIRLLKAKRESAVYAGAVWRW